MTNQNQDLKPLFSVLGNEKSIKSILISCAEIPSITNTYSNGVIELIFGILDTTKSKTDTTDALCTTCIRQIPKLFDALLPRNNRLVAIFDILSASFDIFGILKQRIDTFGGEGIDTNERKNQFRNIISFDLYKSFRIVLASDLMARRRSTNQKAEY